MWIFVLLTFLHLLIRGNYGFSACAEVDIVFIVDTASIINNGDYVLQFITSIIWDGSSEHSGFSVILYGDDIPMNQDIFIVDLKETYSIKQREKMEQAVSPKLVLAFNAIKSVQPQHDTKSVELIEAFKIANKQNKPKRKKNRKKSKLNKKNKNYVVDIRDDENEYFIFDYNNKLLLDKTKELMSKYTVSNRDDETMHFSNDSNATYSDSDNGGMDNILNRKKTINSNHNICFLLHHDANNNDETMHFLLGQKYETLNVKCNGKYPSNIDKRTFFYFDSVELLDNAQKMETIYDITCPANIATPEWSGGMNLGNHVQWIDNNIITECNLEIIDSDIIEKPIEIDPVNSYILVRDYLDDDNTFKKHDYLIAAPEIQQEIENIGCWSAIYHILDIHIDQEQSDYNILRLTVNIPKSPLEYIYNANVKGSNVGIPPSSVNDNNDNNNNNNKNNRALLSFLVLSSGGTQTFTFFDTNDYPGVFDKEWTYSKTTSATYSVGTAPQFTFTGTGTITLNIGFDIDLSISLDFNFRWDVLSNDIYIYMTANIDYGLTVWFNAELVGNVEAAITDLLKYSKYITFSIGPVPVVIKPFITLNAKLTTIPLRIYAGVECHYGELLKIGYEYDMQTIFHAEYGIIRSNHRYTLGIEKEWDNIDALDTCVRQNYDYGASFGLTCVWFDYNPNNKRCRCYGAGVMWGDVTYESGTTAYIMNKECGNEYWHKCDGCGTEIWLKEDGTSFDCTVACFPDFWNSCDSTCHCFPGWYHWYCISCPLFQENSGWEETLIDEHDIDIRIPHSNNGCTKELQFGSEEENEEECPVMQLGFDIEVEAKIGCNLYSIVTVYGRAVLDIPFRITIPEFDDSICSGASETCYNTLKTSFTIAIDLSFYLGVAVDFSDLGELIATLVGGGSQSINDDFGVAEILLGTFQILPVTSLGCIDLNGILSILNVYYKDKCCVTAITLYPDYEYSENGEKWFIGLTLGDNDEYDDVDIGKDYFNELFTISGVIKRDCSQCIDELKTIYYRRIYPNDLSLFDAYNNMKLWSNNNNILNTNFILTNDLNSAVNLEYDSSNPTYWQYCNYNGCFPDIPKVKSFGIRTASGTWAGSSEVKLTLNYDSEIYECTINPTQGSNTDYICDASLIDVNCNVNNQIFIENLPPNTGNALQVDRIYIIPQHGNTITINKYICLAADGDCSSLTNHALIDIDSGNDPDYDSTLNIGCFHMPKVKAFGIRTSSSSSAGTSEAKLTLTYDSEAYECTINPTQGSNTDYMCDASLIGVRCIVNNQIFIENLPPNTGNALQVDRIYIIPQHGNTITINKYVCLAADGDCSSLTNHALIDIDSGNDPDYDSTLNKNGCFPDIPKVKSFGIRTASSTSAGSSEVKLTIIYDSEAYECTINPTQGSNTDYMCDVSLIDLNCNGNNQIFVENLPPNTGNALQVDRIYIIPQQGNTITINKYICLAADGDCSSLTNHALIDIDSGNDPDYDSTLNIDCSSGVLFGGSQIYSVKFSILLYHTFTPPSLEWNIGLTQGSEYLLVDIGQTQFNLIGLFIILNIICCIIYCYRNSNNNKNKYDPIITVDDETTDIDTTDID